MVHGSPNMPSSTVAYGAGRQMPRGSADLPSSGTRSLDMSCRHRKCRSSLMRSKKKAKAGRGRNRGRKERRRPRGESEEEDDDDDIAAGDSGSAGVG